MRMFSSIGKAVRGLFGGEARQDRGKSGRTAPAAGEMGRDDTDNDSEIEEPVAGHYSAWDEVDDVRKNFFLGGWATRRIREFNAIRKHRDQEELKKKQEAEQEGREYKSPLQWELENAARKREEKDRLKEERRRQKEARRRDER
jgi:hypothetical protein